MGPRIGPASEMGIEKIAMWWIPCHCKACRMMMGLPWKVGENVFDFKKSGNANARQFGLRKTCGIFPFSDKESKASLVAKFMDEEADRMLRGHVREHTAALMAVEIEIGGIGDIATPDPLADGCHLVEWTREPFHDQADGEKILVEGRHLNKVEQAPFWCKKISLDPHSQRLDHVVKGSVLMHEISGQSVLPKGFR